MKYTYRHTLKACYLGYITQAIVNNLAPLLFVIFQDSYGLTYEQVGRLILINFGTQIAADIFAAKYVDRIGYRFAAGLAQLLCFIGLMLLGLLPVLLPSPYLGLIFAVILYAVGGGLLEVIVSPIVDALPSDNKETAMSLLHSFYCWGQVGVVLITTLLLRIIGSANWMILPILWSLLPLGNLFLFLRAPMPGQVSEEDRTPLKNLFGTRMFLAALLLMLCAGASELTMSQWSSLFAQRGLGLSKVTGDLLGPCLFAVLMGTGRALYGVYGERIRLRPALILCSLLCMACYLTTVFAPWPLLSLAGCAVCGFSVSLMWPGTFSMTAAAFPKGGTAMFGLLAVCGDLGASVGPWLAGLVCDTVKGTPAVTMKAVLTGEDPAQIGMKIGLLAAVLFPLLMLLGTISFKKKNQSGGLVDDKN